MLCSGYWNLIIQMEKLLAFIGKNEFNSFLCVESKQRLHMSNHMKPLGEGALLSTDSEQLQERLLLWLLHESQLSCIYIFCSQS